MTLKDLDTEMRKCEWWHDVNVPEGLWIIIRVDGRSFTKFTQDMELSKPFDLAFSTWMVGVTELLLTEFQGMYAYTESDEISVLLPPDFEMFNRSIDKLTSVSAGIASAEFTDLCHVPAHFDSRLWIGVTDESVIDYFSWRQADAARCSLNGWVFYTMLKNGLSRRKATQIMKGMPRSEKHDYLMANEINFNELPKWQRRGVGLWYTEYDKAGFNPIKQQVEIAKRRKVVIDRELNMGDRYRSFISMRMRNLLT